MEEVITLIQSLLKNGIDFKVDSKQGTEYVTIMGVCRRFSLYTVTYVAGEQNYTCKFLIAYN